MRLSNSFLLALLVAGAPGCGGGGGGGGADAAPATDAGPPRTEWDDLLDTRVTDWGESLRTASLRLVGDLPTLAEIKFVTEATDPKSAYEATVDGWLADPRFAGQVRDLFRDTFKMGGSAEMDTAPNFAAQLVVEGRPITLLFTATENDCPTFDRATGAFTPGTCDSGSPVRAGVLTNPHVQRQFFSNMGFRRVRWVQETFVCTKFPAEVEGEGMDVGGAQPYTGPWPFTSIGSPTTGGTIDFLDVSAVTCANCHVTMNHQAPLFAHFDEMGMWQADLSVPTPLDGAPMATLADYLADAGEPLAWRFGVEVQDLAGLGAAMAADPAVAECMVARVWNWAMGKGDIVSSLSLVPRQVIAEEVDSLVQTGDLKQIVRQVFTHDDFTKW